jgi:hypothetical protein
MSKLRRPVDRIMRPCQPSSMTCSPPLPGLLGRLFVVLLLSASPALAAPKIVRVPMPPERPADLNERFGKPAATAPSAGAITSLAPAPELHPVEPLEATPGPSACAVRLGELAAFAAQPTLTGPGGCGAVDVVKLEAVTMPDKSRVALSPPATLRCPMAEAVALWVRQEVGPAALTLGAMITSLDNFDSYDCRGRNRIVGAKLSEHGKANALDVRAIRLANGKSYGLTDPLVSKLLRERLRAATCGRFTTVLGPGSDGYHEDHIHMDLAERTRGYRMCQWDVREPPVLVNVPLPTPRPTAQIEAEEKQDQ